MNQCTLCLYLCSADVITIDAWGYVLCMRRVGSLGGGISLYWIKNRLESACMQACSQLL